MASQVEPKLKPVHVTKKSHWAQAHRDWTADNFERVIWNEVCSVEKSKDPKLL